MRRRLLTSLIGICLVAFGGLGLNLGLGNRPLLGLDLQGGASITYRPLTNDYDPDALREVENLYRERIDSLNIGESEVIRQGDTIVVNLPGVKDQEKAIALIGTTGRVTFRPVLARQGGYSGLEVPATGTTSPGVLVTVPATTAAAGSTVPASTIVVQPGQTNVTVPVTPAPSTSAAGGPSRLPSQSATTTPSSQTTLPATSTTAAPSTSAGATTTAGATTSAPSTTAGGPTTTAAPFDPQDIITPADQDTPDATVFLPDRTGTVIYQLGPQFADGEQAVDTAKAEIVNGQWQVSLTLKGGSGGLDAWNRMAAECFRQASSCPDGGMAIIIDHRVISAPVPQTDFFESANVSITGNFKEQEARQLARVLKYGATPVEMTVEASQTVSATIGKDSLRAGVVSGLIGVGLVVILMVLYYRRLALVVVGGICVSAALIWSMVSLFDNFFVLTLAGVTGIIVSIGVTVDSYVVFFERLKDEVRNGRTFRNSAQRGFSAAWRTILAADFVSLLGATVLYYLSVGSVRGFALFLGLSTVCDMVVAWFFTRPAIILLSRSKRFQSGGILGVQQGEALTNPAVSPANTTTGGLA